MKVRELMRTEVLTVTADTSIGDALHQMLWADVRHLPVIENGVVAGVLSQRDVLRFRARLGDAANVTDPVTVAMSQPARVVDPDTGVSEAAAQMAEARVGCLPVVEDGALIGLLTATDVLAHDVGHAFQPPAASPSVTVAAVMTPEPLTTSPEEKLLDAAARMGQRGIRHLPVVNAARQVQGMLTDRDVRSAIGDPRRVLGSETARRRLGELRVRDAMTVGPLAIEQTTPIPDVARYFLEHRIGAIPVVDMDDGDRLVGIVSYVDVIRALLPEA